jgi:hypothetical protein
LRRFAALPPQRDHSRETISGAWHRVLAPGVVEHARFSITASAHRAFVKTKRCMPNSFRSLNHGRSDLQSMIRKTARRFSLATNAPHLRGDHVQSKTQSAMAIRPNPIALYLRIQISFVRDGRRAPFPNRKTILGPIRALLRRPTNGLRRVGRVGQAAACGLDLRLGRPMTARPHLRSRCRILRHVKAHHRARHTLHDTGLPARKRPRRER